MSVGAIGDSITVRNMPNVDFYNGGSNPTPTTIAATYAITNRTYSSESWLLYGAARSHLAWFPFQFICGMSGATSTTILQYIVPACIANPYGLPTMMVVMAGTNDPPASVSQTTTLANLKAIYMALIAAGIQPIATTIFPTNNASFTAAIQNLNVGITRLAAEMGIPCADFYSALMNPTNGQWGGPSGAITFSNQAWTIDGTHQSPAGAQIVGYVLNQTITNFLSSAGGLTTSLYDLGSGVTTQSRNPGFLTITGSVNSSSSYPTTGWNAPGTVADSTVYNSSGTEPGNIHTMLQGVPAIAATIGTPNYIGNSWTLAGDGTNSLEVTSSREQYSLYRW